MIGQSFAPMGNQGKPRPGGPGGGNAQAQQAIKVLNLRLPRVVGAGAGAPQPLLASPGAGAVPMPAGPVPGPGGAPGGAPSFGLEEIIRQIFGIPSQQAQAPDGSAPGGAPAPKVSYQTLPGGTAGPGPGRVPMPNPRRDTKNPYAGSSDDDRQTRPGL